MLPSPPPPIQVECEQWNDGGGDRTHKIGGFTASFVEMSVIRKMFLWRLPSTPSVFQNDQNHEDVKPNHTNTSKN